MAGYEPRLVLKRTFTHPDGRRLLAYQDRDTGWIVELRPADEHSPRARWTPATEEQAAGACWSIMQDDPRWTPD